MPLGAWRMANEATLEEGFRNGFVGEYPYK
jgi:hypothetical protein